MKQLFATLACAAFFAGSHSALAAEDTGDTGNLNITARVHSSCNVNFVNTTINFDIDKDSWRGQTATRQFTVACGAVRVKISLDGGNSGNPDARQMVKNNGATPIPYNVYQGKTTPIAWGDDSSGGNAKPFIIDNTAGGKRFDFRVEVPQYSVDSATEEGNYADRLIATVSYEGAPGS